MVRSPKQKEKYESRIDKQNNIGTYEGSIAMTMNDSSDNKEEQKQINQNKQQLSNINSTTNHQQEKKNKTKNYICSWCQKTDHKTWQSVRCISHQQYLQ